MSKHYLYSPRCSAVLNPHFEGGRNPNCVPHPASLYAISVTCTTVSYTSGKNSCKSILINVTSLPPPLSSKLRCSNLFGKYRRVHDAKSCMARTWLGLIAFIISTSIVRFFVSVSESIIVGGGSSDVCPFCHLLPLLIISSLANILSCHGIVHQHHLATLFAPVQHVPRIDSVVDTIVCV